MPDRDFPKTEVSEVIAKYDGLQQKSVRVLEGTLDMRAEFGGLLLADSFAVQIAAANPHSDRVPALREIGGRTEAIANKHGIRDLRDLHRNNDGTACLCVTYAESQRFPDGSTLLSFIESLVVPYLYALSFFDKNKKWPWPDYSHGVVGLLEFWGENDALRTAAELGDLVSRVRREANWTAYHKQFRKPSAERLCICGSQKSFQLCHPRAWRGVLRVHDDLQRLGLNLDRLHHTALPARS